LRTRAGPQNRRSRLAAWTILILTVIASLIGLANRKFIEWAMLRPYLVARRSGYAGLVTCGFVHADIGHLLFNLITFYSFSFALEREIGASGFAALYLSGLLISSIGTCIKHRDEPQYASLGASGAILAVLFASIVYFPHLRLLILPIPIPIPGPLFALVYLAFSYYSAGHSRGRINHDAHILGAIAGIAFVAVTDPSRISAVVRSWTGWS
jgi:membrane associated rhomboid family serine protease